MERPLKKKNHLSWAITALGFALLVTGIYLLVNIMSPRLLPNKVSVDAPVSKGNQVLSPVANIQAPIIAGGEEVLEKGAWHRKAEQGNPLIGGNFILSAHSFILDLNPAQTREKSYFYSLYRLSEGDDVYIDWEGKRYNYKVTKKYQVDPNAVSIEDQTDEARLTIYTCTPGGSADGRVVIEAKLKK